MFRGKRLKKASKVTKRTAQTAAQRLKKGTAATSSTLHSTSQQAVQARRNAVLQTQRTTARAQQAAANVVNAVEEEIETANLLDRQLARKLLDAVAHGVDMWKIQAKFNHIRINAIVALGTPGCLDGPELEPYIASAPQVAGLSDSEAELRDAVAEGVSDCFGQWQSQVTVPGLPWYPAFAAWPGPAAPPMPNIPVPLIACVSSQVSKIIVPNELHQAMTSALPDALSTADVESGLQQMASSLALAFTTWLPSAQVMLVLGKGPVPTFAPPYVPVGPVINGDVISAPGHLISAPKLVIIMPPTLV